MLAIRSVLFNVAFYASLIIQMIFWTPYYFLAPRKLLGSSRNSGLARACGCKSGWPEPSSDITGMENLPDGPFILAPKHQSFWDTIAFFPYLEDPLYILKRELTWIPFFGWYVMKMRMIPVDRGKKGMALKAVIKATNEELARNPRQLIIYPEGTRRAPGDTPAYKWGIVELYDGLKLPVVPVAHQAGLYWPRRKFLRYPGTIKARFLPQIPAGLPKEEFHARLQRETEAACDQILIDSATGPNPPAHAANCGEAAGRTRLFRQTGVARSLSPTASSRLSWMPMPRRWSSVLSTYSSLRPDMPDEPVICATAVSTSRSPPYWLVAAVNDIGQRRHASAIGQA
jgi:1-acyl-sn-glycerol-3-phosphate acyltransferase